MHNRVRMVAGSLLVKHLLQPWQAGAAWFWDTLVDADLASNSASWQWVAGCGTDAAPYFRVFNPVLQGEKFDPAGRYVRRFVPELAAVPDRWLHRPWEAPAAVLAKAGVVLGRDYPRPVVDVAEGRRRALEAFAAIRGGEAAAALRDGGGEGPRRDGGDASAALRDGGDASAARRGGADGTA
jgi:deoxyribodipyrimidine photo-lyase